MWWLSFRIANNSLTLPKHPALSSPELSPLRLLHYVPWSFMQRGKNRSLATRFDLPHKELSDELTAFQDGETASWATLSWNSLWYCDALWTMEQKAKYWPHSMLTEIGRVCPDVSEMQMRCSENVQPWFFEKFDIFQKIEQILQRIPQLHLITSTTTKSHLHVSFACQ